MVITIIFVVIFVVGFMMLVSKYDNYYRVVKENRKNEEDQSKVLADIKKHNKKCRLIGLAIMVVSASILVFSGRMRPSFSDGGSSAVCSSCNKVFTDSGNVRSIKKTNMCTNCYNNYRVGTDVIENGK